MVFIKKLIEQKTLEKKYYESTAAGQINRTKALPIWAGGAHGPA